MRAALGGLGAFRQGLDEIFGYEIAIGEVVKIEGRPSGKMVRPG